MSGECFGCGAEGGECYCQPVEIRSKDAQSTPQWLFDELNAVHHFRLDAAADDTNHKCEDYYGPGSPLAVDALAVEWPIEGTIWLNPPYSRGNQLKFIQKAIETATRGGRVIALLPADTSTRLFHQLIWKRYHVEFLSRRLRFNGAPSAAKFGSMIVTFSLK